jgi:hypothetical protein
MVIAVLLQVCSRLLARYGKRDDGKRSMIA